MRIFGKTALGLSIAAAVLAGAAGPALAQTEQLEGPRPDDPLIADAILPHNQFAIYNDQEVELIRYKTVRDVEICIARPDPDTVFGTKTAVPVEVQWDNDTGEIWPGNCLSFDAKQVKVRAAQPLPDDTELLGTFKVIH
tara:strand:+ start:31514 stop:31930 length:417 start_codon:yes stop_codon:yes gene_type:complete